MSVESSGLPEAGSYLLGDTFQSADYHVFVAGEGQNQLDYQVTTQSGSVVTASGRRRTVKRQLQKTQKRKNMKVNMQSRPPHGWFIIIQIWKYCIRTWGKSFLGKTKAFSDLSLKIIFFSRESLRNIEMFVSQTPPNKLSKPSPLLQPIFVVFTFSRKKFFLFSRQNIHFKQFSAISVSTAVKVCWKI
jgi:hypothetical protein